MNRRDQRASLSTSRRSRHRSKYININENGKRAIQLPDGDLPRYRRNYVRFRTSSSRSRSRNNLKFFSARLTTDYRTKLILLGIQCLALLHLCSLIYCHQQQPSFAVGYTIVTVLLFNLLTYSCVQYDTQQAEHGGLLLGESPLLFLFWYGGLIGGGLALLIEKHKHLRSQAFLSRLRMMTFFNAIWPFLLYILYMARHQCSFADAFRVLLPSFEAQQHLKKQSSKDVATGRLFGVLFDGIEQASFDEQREKTFRLVMEFLTDSDYKNFGK